MLYPFMYYLPHYSRKVIEIPLRLVRVNEVYCSQTEMRHFIFKTSLVISLSHILANIMQKNNVYCIPVGDPLSRGKSCNPMNIV